MNRALTLALAATLSAPALAQVAPLSAPQTLEVNKVPSPDAGAIILAARDAVAKTQALSYTARTFGVGSLDGKVPEYAGRVSASRAEAGGWRLYIKGQAVKDETIEIGYDGVVARSIREKDKTVIEKTVTDSSDLAVFLSSQQCRPALLWEVLGDAPFAGDAAQAKYRGSATSDGQVCDIVFLPAAAGAGQDADAGVEVWISRTDHLPRRATRFQPTADGAEPKDGRALEVRDLKINSDSVGGLYNLDVPTGYRVKFAEGAPKPKAAPADRSAPPPDPGLLAVGSPAPAWELSDDTGKAVKLADLKGKVVLMDFWATWCPPCRAAMPSVQKLHEKYGDKNVAIYGISCWERGDAPGYMKKQKFTYGLLLKGDKVAEAYGVTGIPTFYLIGPDGKILHAGSGFGPGVEAAIEKKIEEAIAPK